MEIENPRGELEEGYWKALLSEGENSSSSMPPEEGEDIWRDFGVELFEENAFKDENELNRDWQFAQETFENGEILDLVVTGYNRGGLIVDINSLKGFVPASQLIGLPPNLEEEERKAELASWVGEELSLKIIEMDRERNRIVLSERATLLGERKEELIERLSEGDICRGRVTNLRSFGAFVDLGGVEGLIHISELSWGRVNHPKDVLNIGDEIEVYVLNVDKGRGRIGLSLKRLQPDPWISLEERYKVGQLVEGVITNVVNFGAFARIEEGLEGLIHISELANGNFLHPRSIVKEGDVVKARIINVDEKNRRLGLSLRRV
jgi:small subunit ribosomal protein S1